MTSWIAARQASLSFPISQSLLRFMSIESVLLSNHLILCRPLLPLSSVFPSPKLFLKKNFGIQLVYSVVLVSGVGLPRWLSGKESACQCRGPRFNPWVRKIPCRRKWQPTPVFLPGESHGQRSLVGYRTWSHRETDTTE